MSNFPGKEKRIKCSTSYRVLAKGKRHLVFITSNFDKDSSIFAELPGDSSFKRLIILELGQAGAGC